MKDYIKHFNQQSEDYLHFRPDYPDALYDYLESLVTEHQSSWDCGTGNGQAALALAKHFEQVIATDINQGQLDVALKSEKIRYICCAAEKTPIANNSVDLITVAQALHWFNFDLFYKEVRRVSKKSAIIAAWCYSPGKVNTFLDNIINKLYADILGEYWPAQRKYVDEGYRSIPFPFSKIVSPSFTIEKNIDFSQLIGFLHTWSAVKEYELRNKVNPINLIFKELESAWGNVQHHRLMRWPIHLLVGLIQ